MSIKDTIRKVEKILSRDIPSIKENLSLFKTPEEILYNTNIIIFTSSSIDHKKRLELLKKINKVCLEYNLSFCKAHNLTLCIKVSRELGLKRDLIKDSHNVIDLWKKLLDKPLSINGLIFSYTDLGLIFSDSNLNLLAIKYLNKAESIISECEDRYNPTIKLYVAYAVVYSKMKDLKKASAYYNKVIKLAKSKKDSLTLIPVLINTSSQLIDNKNYLKAKRQCQEALKISSENSDKIYKPYIYHELGKIYLKINDHNKSDEYLNLALDLFKRMKSTKMIPKVLESIGRSLYKQKQYDEAMRALDTALSKNKKTENYDLDIIILKIILSIHKKRKNNKELIITKQLNKVLEKQVEHKQKVFSETNINALRYLSEELNLLEKRDHSLKAIIDLTKKKRESTTEALASVSEREFLKKIIKEISSNKLDNKKLVNLFRERIKCTKDWNIFMKLFNDIHPQFNKYIINKCSEITESELRICNLIKMNFSSLEITEILSISKRGVEQHRYRIKKKLNLKTDLTIFIQSL